MASPNLPLSVSLEVMVKEGKRRIVLLASILAIVSLAALALGIVLPKRYDATALLAVELGASAKLVEGRTTATKAPDLTPVTLQFTEGKKVIREILLFGGWVQPPPAKQLDPREEEQLINKVRGRIRIDTGKEGFVRIAFWDNDPDRVYQVVNKLAEIFIREAMDAQLRDAQEALKFIDDQVKEYGEKLATVHQQVISHYRGIEQNVDVPRPATPGQTTPRPAAKVDVAALRAEKAQLEAQLARKTNIAMPDPAAENAARARVASLQAELDRLRAAYTEEHPDVKRVKRELATATEELRNLEAARKAREADAARAAALDEELRATWRARLETIDKQLAAATGVPVTTTTAAKPRAAATTEEVNPDIKGIGPDTTLAELVRRYEATRDVYQDLLKRRETARVTLDLVTQDRGFKVRVQEPAEKPIAATGLRLSHFCLVGLLLGCLLPVGILFAIVRFDPRVRSPHQIEALARVPLLVSITPTRASGPSPVQRQRTRIAIALVVSVFVVYLATFIIRTRA